MEGQKKKRLIYTAILFAIICSTAVMAVITWPATSGSTLTAEMINYLHKWDNSSNNIFNNNTGNVGIGTSTPTSKLSVNGRIEDQTGYVMPTGSMIMYGGATAPKGWLLCNGSTISRTTYADLFAAISTTYGVGDGSTTFRLPDFRGIFPKGTGQQGTAAWGGANYAGTLGTYTQDKMQGHRHTINRGGNALYSIVTTENILLGTSGGTTGYIGDPNTDGTHGTPRTGYTTEPASLGVNYIIKY